MADDSTSADLASAPEGEVIVGAADVLVDGSGRLGALSYLVPSDVVVHVGDAVHVPFGKREGYGVALGPGDVRKATRELIGVFGRRAHPADVEAARTLSARHFCPLSAVASRLAPRTHKGAVAVPAGDVRLTDADRPRIAVQSTDSKRRHVLRSPQVSAARLAAELAAELAEGGQVLVLCPTVTLVAAVIAEFESGAARLDAAAARGSWRGFVEGVVPIGVGTRAAALYSPAKLAGIVVVEEDHPGHVEAHQPHTHARDVASLRTAERDVAFVVTSKSPTPAGLGGKVKVVRAGSKREWPTVEVIDRSGRPAGSRAVPPKLRSAIDRCVAEGGRPVIMAPRRQAKRRCARCNTERACPTCGLVRCQHGAPAHSEVACSRCGETDTKVVGWDAERIEGYLGRKVKAVGPGGIVKVSNAPLVVIFDIDSVANSPGLDPEAAVTRVVTDAAAATAPGGHLIICTSRGEDLLLADLANRDALGAARKIWAAAREAQLPPFGRLVTIRAARRTAPSVSSWPGQVFGPKRVGAEEWEILVRVPDDRLAALAGPIERLRRSSKVRITVS